MPALLDDRIRDVAEHQRDGTVGLNVYGESRTFHHLAATHLHGSYLKDVVLKDVQSGCLRIEHHDGVLFVMTDETAEISGGAVIAQEVGGKDGTVEQCPNEAASGGIAFVHSQSLHKARPRHKAELIVEHAKMGKQELHLRRRENVRARHLEMSDAATMELLAEHLGVAVGIHHNGCRRLREVGAKHGSELHAVANLLVEVVRIDNLEFVSCQRQIMVSAHFRQQGRVDVHHLRRIRIEDVEEITRRTMVDRKMMELACRTLLDGRERVHLGSHEGEDGLLFVAEEHDCVERT